MRSSIKNTRRQKAQRRHPAAPETRFDRRLSEILDHATEVFCEKGYEGASMRDLSRATGMSLAGLYHYFGSKERLLYLIQKHTFSTIVEQLKEKLDCVSDPAQRIRVFIHNHLDYFVANQSGLKVLSHEDEALNNGYSSRIASIKREYYRICLGLLDELKRGRKLEFNSRAAVMSLFGMINWIYTWYKPRVDGSADQVAREMGDIFLKGVSHCRTRAGLSFRSARGRSRERTGSPPGVTTRSGRKAVKRRAVRRAARRST